VPYCASFKSCKCVPPTLWTVVVLVTKCPIIWKVWLICVSFILRIPASRNVVIINCSLAFWRCDHADRWLILNPRFCPFLCRNNLFATLSFWQVWILSLGSEPSHYHPVWIRWPVNRSNRCSDFLRLDRLISIDRFGQIIKLIFSEFWKREFEFFFGFPEFLRIFKFSGKNVFFLYIIQIFRRHGQGCCSLLLM